MADGNGPFRVGRKLNGRTGGDSIGSSNLDAPPPRLMTLRQIRKDKKLKDDLYGETDKIARAKVTLPKFSWDKKDDLAP